MATTGRGPPELRTRRSASLPNPQFLRSDGRDAHPCWRIRFADGLWPGDTPRVRGHAGRVTLPSGMRGRGACGAATNPAGASVGVRRRERAGRRASSSELEACRRALEW